MIKGGSEGAEGRAEVGKGREGRTEKKAEKLGGRGGKLGEWVGERRWDLDRTCVRSIGVGVVERQEKGKEGGRGRGEKEGEEGTPAKESKPTRISKRGAGWLG